MTAVFNYIWWGIADPDKSDPVTGLTKRDLYHIRKSWVKIFCQPIDSGMLIFVKLFRTEPSTQDFFVTIKGLPEEKFTTLPQFKAHVLNFMTSLNEAVTTIQEASVVVQLMRRLGRTHRKFHVKPEHFNIVTQVLVDTLKNNFQAEDDVISAWSKLLVFLFKPLFEELRAETH